MVLGDAIASIKVSPYPPAAWEKKFTKKTEEKMKDISLTKKERGSKKKSCIFWKNATFSICLMFFHLIISRGE